MDFPLDYRQGHGSKSLRVWIGRGTRDDTRVDACDKNDNFIEQHSSKRWGDFDNLLDVFEGLKNRLYFVRNFDISLSVPSGKGPPFYSLEL